MHAAQAALWPYGFAFLPVSQPGSRADAGPDDVAAARHLVRRQRFPFDVQSTEYPSCYVTLGLSGLTTSSPGRQGRVRPDRRDVGVHYAGIAPFACETPDDVLFWDGIHPRRAAHTIVAQQATQALSR